MGRLTEFRKDLNNGMSIEEALFKHHLTLKEAMGDPKNTRRFVKPTKKGTIAKNHCSEHFRVSKMIHGKHIGFGTYRTRKEAEIVRAEMHKVGWDINSLPEVLKKTKIKRVLQNDRKLKENTNIYKNPAGNFYITKVKDKTRIFGGTYGLISEARVVRDELAKNNWDTSHLDEICKKYGIQRTGG